MQGQDNRCTRGVALFWRRTAVAGRTSAIALLIATGALVATPSLAAAAAPAGVRNLAPKVFKLPQLPASFSHRTAKAGAARLPLRPRIAPRNAVFQTFLVDTGTDPASGTSCATGHATGTCSLRAAIAAANADAGHIDAVTIPSGTTVVLAQGLLDLTSSMYINGAGATVNGSGTGIFEELEGTSYPAVDITGLTLTGGAATNGGAIYCDQGSLVLSQVDITGNTASGSGGGLYSTSACDLWMDGSTVSKNTASTDGGGLYLGGSANISRSTIGGSSAATGNIAPDGAGLYNSGGTVELADSSVNYNSSPGLGVGVGVYNGDVLDVSNCTIDDNLAAAGANGAGVANYQTLAVTDSSISYNSVTGAAGSYGAGLYDEGISSLQDVFFLGNSSMLAANQGVYGGGVFETGDGFTWKGVTISGTSNGSSTVGSFVDGGALFVQSGDSNLNGVTISDTTNLAGPSSGVDGGAIFEEGGFFSGSGGTVENVSISNTVNTGYYLNGGALLEAAGGPFSSTPLVHVTISGTNNHISGIAAQNGGQSTLTGGAVYNDSTLAISGLNISGTSDLADLGTQTTPSTVHAVIEGGVIFNNGRLVADHASVTGTTATAAGGAGYVDGGAWLNAGNGVLRSTQIVGVNVQADSYVVGGIFADSGTLTANGFTLGNGVVRVLGGPDAGTTYGDGTILDINGPTSIVNGTFANVGSVIPNTASYLWAIDDQSTLQLTNSTIVGDALTGPGAGSWLIWVRAGEWTAVRNSIVDSNPPALNCGVAPTGQLVSAGYNIDNGSTCGFTGVGDMENTDPMLLPLASNGGPVETSALQAPVGAVAGSPAIDAGSNVGCPATDARGVVRPQGTACDIGAYELAADGYWLAAPTGKVFHFGAGSSPGSLSGSTSYGGPIVAIVPSSDGGGYLLVGSKGGVSPVGDAVSYGNLAQLDLSAPVVAAAATPDGGGYWLVTRDGRVYPFGDARNYGQMGRHHIVVAIAVTPDGDGYWLVTSTGHVWTFGDAVRFGNAPGKAIVAMAATPDGGGYWLVASNGQVFPYGDATGYGSATGLKAPVVGIVVTPDAMGYWLIMSTGRVLRFGDAVQLSTSVKTALVSGASAG